MRPPAASSWSAMCFTFWRRSFESADAGWTATARRPTVRVAATIARKRARRRDGITVDHSSNCYEHVATRVHNRHIRADPPIASDQPPPGRDRVAAARLLPLDRTRRLRRDVVGDPVDPAHLVD